jgi:hypothetical protein
MKGSKGADGGVAMGIYFSASLLMDDRGAMPE